MYLYLHPLAFVYLDVYGWQESLGVIVNDGCGKFSNEFRVKLVGFYARIGKEFYWEDSLEKGTGLYLEKYDIFGTIYTHIVCEVTHII